MNISINVSGIDGVMDELAKLSEGDNMQRALTAAGEELRKHAVALCPVDTGNLRGSIETTVEGNSALVGPTAPYGAYVEYGAGSAGNPTVAHTTKKHWTYYKGGRFYTTSGQAPQPYMIPAAEQNVSSIIKAFRDAYLK